MEKLDNSIRDYDWGSSSAITELLGRTPTGGPEAELWIGSHPGAPECSASSTAPASAAGRVIGASCTRVVVAITSNNGLGLCFVPVAGRKIFPQRIYKNP